MQKDPEKDSLLAHVLADRSYAAMLGLGFSAASVWLSEVPIETIGLMSELTIAYKLKFVWAPFLDKYDAPKFSALLGRRRGWIVVSQRVALLKIPAALVFLAILVPEPNTKTKVVCSTKHSERFYGSTCQDSTTTKGGQDIKYQNFPAQGYHGYETNLPDARDPCAGTYISFYIRRLCRSGPV
jgi:acetyl-CoA transporter-like protein